MVREVRRDIRPSLKDMARNIKICHHNIITPIRKIHLINILLSMRRKKGYLCTLHED